MQELTSTDRFPMPLHHVSRHPNITHFIYLIHLRQGHSAFVCLCVCLLATSRTTTEQTFMKMLPEMYLCTRKNWIDFISQFLLDPNLGILGGFFNIARYGTFPHCSSYLWIGCLWKFYQMYLWTDKEVPLNPDQDSWSSDSGLRVRTGSALAEVCSCLKCVHALKSCSCLFHFGCFIAVIYHNEMNSRGMMFCVLNYSFWLDWRQKWLV